MRGRNIAHRNLGIKQQPETADSGDLGDGSPQWGPGAEPKWWRWEVLGKAYAPEADDIF